MAEVMVKVGSAQALPDQNEDLRFAEEAGLLAPPSPAFWRWLPRAWRDRWDQRRADRAAEAAGSSRSLPPSLHLAIRDPQGAPENFMPPNGVFDEQIEAPPQVRLSTVVDTIQIDRQRVTLR